MRKTNPAFETLVIVIVVLMLFPAQVFAGTSSTGRLAGGDRIATAVAVADSGWTSATTAILAPSADANLFDALAAAPLAGEYDAPILLTDNNNLSDATKNEIQKLGVKNVYVVGAISQSVVDQLNSMSGVSATTFKGADRLATAAAIASKLTNPAGSFIVGYGALPDALSVASFAAANNYAILIANPDGSLPSTETPYMRSNVYIIGGPRLVSDIAGAKRIYGQDRFETNQKVLSALNYKYDDVYVANGTDGHLVDSLVASSLAAKYKSPIILCDSSGVKAAAGVAARMSSNSEVIALGGGSVVPDAFSSVVLQAGSSSGTTAIPTSIPPVTVTTTAGTAPSLPAAVTATLSDGTTQSVVVTWPTIDPSQYANAGTFTVTGTVANSPLTATANITVNAAQNQTGGTVAGHYFQSASSKTFPDGVKVVGEGNIDLLYLFQDGTFTEYEPNDQDQPASVEDQGTYTYTNGEITFSGQLKSGISSWGPGQFNPSTKIILFNYQYYDPSNGFTYHQEYQYNPQSQTGSSAGTTVAVSSVAPVTVTTTAGTAPALPATVTATLSDGTTQSVAVTWSSIDPSQYANAGTFSVSGTIANSTVTAVANVTVNAGAATVVSVAPVTVTTTAGTAPTLPATVTATLSDGTTQSVAVTWPTIDPSQYANAGTFIVTVTIANSTVTAQATVTVNSAALSPKIATALFDLADPIQNSTITIEGTGFGQQPAYNGDSADLIIHDVNSDWNAGNGNDAVTLNVTQWTDNKIVINGFTGSYGGGWSINPGDKLLVGVLNPQSTSTTPATYQIVIPSSAN